MTAEEKFDNEVWWVIKKLKYIQSSTVKGEDIEFVIEARPPTIETDTPSIDAQARIILKLQEWKAIKGVDYEEGYSSYGRDFIYTLKILQPKFDKLYRFYESNFEDEKVKTGKETQSKRPTKFVVSVKDREIWVNGYLIGKPHGVGSNFEFFEYVRSQPANTKIERADLPDFSGGALKNQIKNKSFIKILNELGFKGQILKAFFYKRGKDSLTYRGNEITEEDLIRAGVKVPLLLKELEVSHIKNSPE